MKLMQLKPRQTRSLILAVVLSVVIAAPVMSQPLGLTSILTTNVSTAEDIPEAAPDVQAEENILAAPESFGVSGDGLSRSQSENAPVNDDADLIQEEISETENVEPEKIEPEEILPEYEGPEFLPQNKTLYVNASELNMRQSFSEDAPILEKIPMGKKIKSIGESDEWLRVEYNGRTGYAVAEYLTEDMVFVPVEQTRYVDASALNIRITPSSDADSVETLATDAKVTRIGVGDGWSKIKSANGNEGYVASKYLTDEVPASVIAAQQAAAAQQEAERQEAERQAAAQQAATEKQAAPKVKQGAIVASADKAKIVEIAWSGLGVPYVYAGSSLSGFDCSGYTSWVYRQVGISLPRSTSGYYSAGSAVSLSNLQPGDVIAMDANSRDGRTDITHVGIYVGNGQMLHASTSRRQIVAVNVNAFFGYGITPITVRRFVD